MAENGGDWQERGWFRTRSLGQGVWAIDDHGQDTIYLVIGAERCLLVDTGWGVGDLPGVVAALTDRPVTVVNSHGHPDHACGNGQFPTVHIARADEWLVREPMSLEERRWIVEHLLPRPLPADLTCETWPPARANIVPVEDGHIFDLGDRAFEAVLIPGHTAGSLCLLDRKNRLLLAGDTVLAGPIWLHLEESTPLGEFRRSLERLQDLSGEFDRLLPAHGETPLPGKVIDDLASGIEAILEGRIAGRPEKTFAGDGLRCDFGSCGIVYRPERL